MMATNMPIPRRIYALLDENHRRSRIKPQDVEGEHVRSLLPNRSDCSGQLIPDTTLSFFSA